MLWLDTGPVVINAIIDDYTAIPGQAAVLAARAHAAWRERSGNRQMISPDLLIGAHDLLNNLVLRAGSAALALCWAESSRATKLLPVPAQPAQISSRSIASPGNWGSPSRRVAASSRRGGAGHSASGPQTSTARSSGINSQPRRAPLR